MDQSANGEECGICLDALANPVALPCSHKFCSKCLNGWRSKYGVQFGDKEANSKCPLCLKEIPPSKEMITQLKCLRIMKSEYEAKGDFLSEKYIYAKSRVEELEREVGDWTETIDYSDGNNCVVLPGYISLAASQNDIQKVLDWLGPLPVDKQRVNARCPEVMESTLMFPAAANKNSNLLSILLQLGADVDPVDASGKTPLEMCYKPEYYALARVLLEWGAEISNCPKTSVDVFIQAALEFGNSKLANLLKSEFGGRRCEIINLPKHPDLIGKNCVVEKYLPDKARYKVTFEASKEVGLVGPQTT